MSVAWFRAATGESITIQFSVENYAITGSGGAWKSLANDLRVSLDVPPDRPLPTRVLINLHPEADDRKEFALEPAGQRSYSGQLDCSVVIRTGFRGDLNLKKQEIEFILQHSSSEGRLIDPINRTTRFQIDLFAASASGLSQ